MDQFMGVRSRLLGGSPAIDTGTSAGAPNVDFENDARPVDGNNDGFADFDIGADEFAFGLTVMVREGTPQECLSPGGNDVTFVVLPFPRDLALSMFRWQLDGEPVSGDIQTDQFISLGDHMIEVEATTSTNETLRASATVSIVDTLSPSIEVAFIDLRDGEKVSVVESSRINKIAVDIDVRDICDLSPEVDSVYGIPTADGEVLRAFSRRGALLLDASEVQLSVMASDGSGNVSSAGAYLQVRP